MVSDIERSSRRGLVGRAWGILFNTEEEWDIVNVERDSLVGLIVGYACLLALIQPLARIPQSVLMIHWTLGQTIAITAVRCTATSVLGPIVVGLIINALAPAYHGEANLVQAMKLSIYSATPGWAIGLLHIIPIPDFLDIVAGAYGLYILCLGLPTPLMRASREETVGYFVGAAFSTIVIGILSIALVHLIGNQILQGVPLDASAAYGA